MLRVGRMVRVLRRLRQLRHVDVVLRPLRVPRVDVVAGDPSRLLCTHIDTYVNTVGVHMYGRIDVWSMKCKV